MEKKAMINSKIFSVIFLLTVVMTTSSYAQEVPANLQAALFKKIFAFDKTLQGKSIEVVVIGGGSDEIVAAFKGAGVDAKAAAAIGNASVVYLMSGVAKQATSSKGILSISGDVSNVEGGKVAIAVGIEGGKPKIIINMGQLKAEGQELSADLLKIARVIQ